MSEYVPSSSEIAMRDAMRAVEAERAAREAYELERAAREAYEAEQAVREDRARRQLITEATLSLTTDLTRGMTLLLDAYEFEAPA